MDWIATRLTDIGEDTAPTLNEVIAEYEGQYKFNCHGCESEKSFPIEYSVVQQIYQDQERGALREVVFLRFNSPRKMIQCSECDSVYQLIGPEPIFDREEYAEMKREDDETPPRAPEITPTYDQSNIKIFFFHQCFTGGLHPLAQ
ncbi:MAG: hypothetical protein KKD75_01725 [Nanoarchaeota archaeon]|nr:hypothetical protein [Nanoarchaeota archaeon]MBU1632590.1 hypothetical protein [Nanoarchaeota archaeon]MBU1876111.1 hypothetical protein [Nanoarchaeota archaeon]